MSAPYYSDGICEIWHEDCREMMLDLSYDVIVTDPPFGIGYESGRFGALPRSIKGDHDVTLRDTVLSGWSGPALVFGSWRAPRPSQTRMVLVWDSGGALGMGALDLPWKPAHQEIYVLGAGFKGPRTSDVLRFPPVQAMAANGRVHPHQKPVELMSALVAKCLDAAVIMDPFCGSGTTLVAAKAHGRRAIGIEIEERYCEIAAKRLAQEVLDFAPPSEAPDQTRERCGAWSSAFAVACTRLAGHPGRHIATDTNHISVAEWDEAAP